MSQVEINVTGTGSAIRPAERALLSLSAVSPQVKTPAEASSIVTATANAIRDIIIPLCPQDEQTGRTLPDAPIVHYSLSTMDTSSHTQRSRNQDGKMETDDPLYSARAEFIIKFQHFDTLNKIATQLSGMDHVRISSVGWKLTDATLDSIRGGARKRAGMDAIQKAWDYAEVFAGVEGGEQELKRRVKAVNVVEDRYYSQNTSPRMHRGKGLRSKVTGSEQLQFEPEDVQLEVNVTTKFVVDL